MSRYHIHPETGDPGRCRALRGGCPFGDSDTEHYDSEASARSAYEFRQTNGDGALTKAHPENQRLFRSSVEAAVAAAANEIVETYSYDLGKRRVKDEKSLMAFLARDHRNHIAFARTQSTIATRFEDFRLFETGDYFKLKHDFSRFSPEELKEVARVTPAAASEWAERKWGRGDAAADREELYATLTEGEGTYLAAQQAERRQAIRDVLGSLPLAVDLEQDRSLYLDASAKLETEQGLDRKTFSRALKEALGSWRGVPQKHNETLREIVRRARGDQ